MEGFDPELPGLLLPLTDIDGLTRLKPDGPLVRVVGDVAGLVLPNKPPVIGWFRGVLPGRSGVAVPGFFIPGFEGCKG